MRTLAYFFKQDATAAAARDAIARQESVAQNAMELAPLVVENEDGTLLALSVSIEARDAVDRIAASHGGRLVVDLPQDWL